MNRILAGLDSCIFIEAARDPNGLCHVILGLAFAGVFDVLVAPQTVDEVERNLSGPDQRSFLEACRSLWKVCEAADDDETPSRAACFLAVMRHAEDVPIALAISGSSRRPQVFLSSNTRHWKPSLSPLLGAQVMSPKRFLEALGEPIPQKRYRSQRGRRP